MVLTRTQGLQRQLIALHAQSGDYASADRTQVGVRAKFLAGEDIGPVDLLALVPSGVPGLGLAKQQLITREILLFFHRSNASANYALGRKAPRNAPSLG